MHMADALVSPAVGGVFWAASAGMIYYSSKKAPPDINENKIPLMGVIGAFVFAAQMVNFTIPGTGSSGHLGGALLLSILLGPYAAFITISSVLIVQALFFADGGILSLGCNMFNIGLLPCFIAYPLIYKNISQNSLSQRRVFLGTMLAAVIGSQLGALGVILQTLLSNVSELTFTAFSLLLLPIQLCIGIGEGIITIAVIQFVMKVRPELVSKNCNSFSEKAFSLRKISAVFLAATIIVGGLISWYASSNPDGLEWSIFKTAGTEEISGIDSKIHSTFSKIQEKIAFLPDYNFKSEHAVSGQDEPSAEALKAGTSLSGLIGGALTLIFTIMISIFLKQKKSDKNIGSY
ncbi:MAG: energy-coupling factor ABC transporter permease [Pseudomonadota bacterium]